jgi:hypothetical protein
MKGSQTIAFEILANKNYSSQSKEKKIIKIK